MDCCLLDKLALARGQVPLNFDEGGFNVRRFATRAWGCGERVRYPTIFPKSLIRYLMTGDGIVANRGLIEMLESLFALAITALRSPPMHRRTALKASLLAFP